MLVTKGQRKPKVIAFGIILILLSAGTLLFFSSPQVLGSEQPNWVGISLHSLSPNDAALVKGSGVGWVRVDCGENFSSVVVAAKARGLGVVGILDCWMFGGSLALSLKDWMGNVTFYVSTYADCVDAWEIWNEPSSMGFPLLYLNVSTPQARAENMSRIVDFYYDMAQSASEIIRRYDPSATIVLLGGPNLNSADAPNLEIDKEFARMLASRSGRSVMEFGDAISLHAYPWGPVQPAVWGNYTDSLSYYQRLFNVSASQVWITETGQPVEDSGEDGQAQHVADTLQYFEGRAAHVFWYSLKDNINDINCFGLTTNAGTPRQAYYTLKQTLNPTPASTQIPTGTLAPVTPTAPPASPSALDPSELIVFILTAITVPAVIAGLAHIQRRKANKPTQKKR